MTANMGPANRDDRCPARGPMLAHTPDPVNQLRCRHCGTAITLNTTPAVPEQAGLELASIDVAARLRMMGLMPDPDPRNEPKMVDKPMGPAGPLPRWSRNKMAPGRTVDGTLSNEDKHRLNFFVHVVRTRTQEDRPEDDV